MGSRAARIRVLLIDDHDDTREMYAGYLASVGMDVRAAADGEAGVKVALEWRPDIVVTDWSMPGMTGDEATRQLKSDARTRQIPVVILTAFGLQQRAELEATGASAVCGKPCTPPDLQKLILGTLAPSSTKRARRRGTKRMPGPKRASVLPERFIRDPS
jgi:CheY-like chemotaxis protein